MHSDRNLHPLCQITFHGQHQTAVTFFLKAACSDMLKLGITGL